MLILIIKQMTSVFIDDSGSPVIDSRGNILLLEDKAEYIQSIVNVFKTLKYSETFIPSYGFDMEAIINSPSYVDVATQIRVATFEALNPDYVKCVASVDMIDITVEDGMAVIDLAFVAENGESYSFDYTLKVEE